MLNELPFEKLRQECDPALMQCETTEETTPIEGIIGQERAVKALRFGLDIKESGFNIYVAGIPGTGRTTAVREFLEQIAKAKPIPGDWCYVNNFSNPYEPKAIRLPPGKGKNFREDMKNFISEARRVLPETFASEDYATKKEATTRDIEETRNKLFAQLSRRAEEEGFTLQNTPIGLLIIPVMNGQPISEQNFLALSPQIRDEIEKRREKLSGELRSAMRQLRGLEGKANEEIKKMNREVALYAIGQPVAELSEKYKELPEIITYLEEVQNDILDNISQFIREPEASPPPFPASWMKEILFKKYEINVIVDNSDRHGAPVIRELNPTHQNLFGRIEKEAQFGILTTDFTMIRGGSLHKANEGYLVVSAEELLRNLFSWDDLKTSLMNEKITVEETGERLGFITTKGLKPAPIPLNIKVILIGNPLLYLMLYTLDPDFKQLFKIKADFDITMERTEENMRKYVSFICTLCQKENLKHLHASAVAKIIEYSSRLAADQEKLSTRFADIADIIREANFYATHENSKYITSSQIKKAIEEKAYRSNLIQEKIQEMIQRNILLIDTESEAIGQMNGLSVISLGDVTFGRPSRVTASVSLGREGIIDIEREVRLGGRIHSKGVMILSGYLAETYAQNKPFSLSARLVFEQSYEEVEGDSASSAELYALLSSLSGLPIKQGVAVTGSVNQKGEIQAIGGVNEKIEGFFEVCKAKGLTNAQGVIIPESNVPNLMLKEEVVDNVKAGKFHIYPVKTVDQGIEILTGVKAGTRQPDRTFEEGTVNYRVDNHLKQMVERVREFPEFVADGRKKE